MRASVRATAGACALTIAAGLALVLVPMASATTSSFVWTGNASGHDWSFGSNWEGGSQPSSAEPVTLEFPRLPDCSGSSTCYTSENNVSGLTAESIKLDNGDEYALSGDGITLGSGGLTASPASGSSGAAGDFIELPFQLSASQTWSIAGRNGGGLGENGALLQGNLTGSSATALTFEISNEAKFILNNETEVGPTTISGADTSEAGIFNGFVEYFADLNFSNGNPVSVNHIFLIGSGAIGALRTNDAELDIGSASKQAEGIIADSATFDSGSGVGFQITGTGGVAGEDYSQLESAGPIELGGSTLFVEGLKPEGGSCPSLGRGQTYTFVSTTGKLSGSFANAPEGGPELDVEFTKECATSPRPMRIEYHETGATETVIGTVEAAAKEKELQEEHERQVAREAKEHKEAQERQETSERQEMREREATKQREETTATLKHAEEVLAATTKQREEEATGLAGKRQEEEAATRKHEEELAKIGVLAAKEESKPKRLTRAQRLAKALTLCRKETKKKRAQCEALARKKYGSKAKNKKGSRR
jgi:hypothetical protein